jgi:hypothetical protein
MEKTRKATRAQLCGPTVVHLVQQAGFSSGCLMITSQLVGPEHGLPHVRLSLSGASRAAELAQPVILVARGYVSSAIKGFVA